MIAIQNIHQNLNMPSRSLNTWSESLCADVTIIGFPYNKQEDNIIGIDYDGV